MRKTLVAVLASVLALAVAAPATATTKDDDFPVGPFPLPGHTLCVLPIDVEPPAPVYGELPVLEDPVHGASDGVACSTGIESFANADIEVVVAKEETEWDFNKANNQQTGQITIKSIVSPAGIGEAVSPLTVTYKVTVTPAVGPARTENVVVQVFLAQGNSGAVGGFNITSFNPPIPQGAKVKVELTTGLGQVRIGNTLKPFTIKAADQGEKARP